MVNICRNFFLNNIPKQKARDVALNFNKICISEWKISKLYTYVFCVNNGEVRIVTARKNIG